MVNEWTIDDLPTEDEAAETYMAKGVYSVHEGIALVLDAVVDHLNAHYPKPSPEHVVIGGRLTISESQFKRERDVFAHRLENQSETIAEMQGVIKGLHRAHEIVEQERDQAREQWKKWEHKAHEADREVSTWRSSTESAHSDFLQAAYDRDEWKARADEWQASAKKCYEAWQKITPARTVTREDVEKVVRRYIPSPNFSDPIADEVCSLFGVEAEPAVDPLLDKAQEFAALADWELTDREAWLLHTVAAYVLGGQNDV